MIFSCVLIPSFPRGHRGALERHADRSYPCAHFCTSQLCGAAWHDGQHLMERGRGVEHQGQHGGQAVASPAELCCDTYLGLAQKLASHFKMNSNSCLPAL